MTLTLEEFFSYFVIAGVLLLVAVALSARFLDWLLNRSFERSKVECRLCGMRFFDEGKGKVAVCPHCQALNRH